MTSTDETIYLDFNATTPIAPEVVDAMTPYLSEHFGNPSSGHRWGREARRAVERAREQVALLIGAAPSEIFFTGSATEANNLAIRGRLAAVDGGHIVTSAIEHPAVEQPCALLERRHGDEVTRVAVDETGRVDAAAVIEAVEADTELISVMHANNVVGTLQPIAEISRRLAELTDGAPDILLHTDAAQTVGKIPVSVDALGVDLLTIAGHKFYAPKGVGALYVRGGLRATALEPVVVGAGHEEGLRPGTENVAGIVALGEACRWADERLDERRAHMQRLREELWERLSAAIDGLALNGHPRRRLPNTLNVRFPGVSGARVLEEAEIVAASTGSACHEDGAPTPSSVLVAMDIDPGEALGSVRLSVGETTTDEDIEQAAEALVNAWESLRE